MTEIEKITGGNYGMLFIDAAVTDKSFHTLVVNADCVLTVLADTAGNNLLTIYGLGSKTLKQGMIINGMGNPIKNVTPSSGSLIGYNSKPAA